VRRIVDGTPIAHRATVLSDGSRVIVVIEPERQGLGLASRTAIPGCVRWSQHSTW
jgi:hypothetical protein